MGLPVSFKYISFVLKLLFLTNEIIVFSKILGLHKNLHKFFDYISGKGQFCEVFFSHNVEQIVPK